MSFEPQPQPDTQPAPSLDRTPDAYAREVQRFRARTPGSIEELERARRYLPGGVCSNFRLMDPHPIYVRWARGSRLADVDGNEYVDWAMAQSTLMAGHAHPAVLAAVRQQADNGTMTCIPFARTAEVAKVVCEMFRLEQVRFTNTGGEATMYATRVARGATGRDMILKFDACYHGNVAELMLGRGETELPPGAPEWMGHDKWTNGVPEDFFAKTLVASYNDLDSVRACFRAHPGKIAAVILEPVAFNMGICLPRDGFLQGLREICDREGAVLIYDEVKMGCKLGPLGAGEYFGVPADLVCMAKSIGGGFPIGLFGGKRELMEQIVSGGVKHVGTYAANPVSLAAAYATLTQVLTPASYERIFATSEALAAGYREIIARTGIDAHVVTLGAAGSLFLGRSPVYGQKEFLRTRTSAWPLFWLGMVNRGVIPQGYSPEDIWTVSVQHTEEDVETSLRAFREVAPLLG
jgi:glutamate-1-semialdehyde 2,1-aminomutase